MEEKFTSEEWAQLEEYKDILICAYDGWDRDNFEYSWHVERITESEFQQRVFNSTITVLFDEEEEK